MNEEVEYDKNLYAYDQYMHFDKIPKLLKRFSFDEKMRICHMYSRQAIAFENYHDYEKLSRIPLPWCLETFAMLSIEAYEYSDGNFLGKKQEDKFLKMIDAIRNHAPDTLKKHGDNSAIDYIMPVMALTQFYLQELYWIKFYRYWVFFSNNSSPTFLKDRFFNKFGTDYYDFLLLGGYLKAFFLPDKTLPKKIIEYLLFQKFPKAASALVISREKYIDFLKQFVSDMSQKAEFIYCIRPSYQYPFIQYEDRVYVPLPHLFTQNITSSLFYRITANDNLLRAEIGKHVIEPYLLRIMQETEVYDEVFPEQTYRNPSENRSPDVIARKGKEVLFLDSKSTVPGRLIRIFDEEAYKRNIEITAENIAKLYKQINNFMQYNPFAGSVSNDKNDFWGGVVVLEDSYIPRKKFYESARCKLQITKDSLEWNWLITHIKICGLYDIERLCFCSCNIMDALKEQFQSGNPYDYAFVGLETGKGAKLASQELLRFKDNVMGDIHKITIELQEKNII